MLGILVAPMLRIPMLLFGDVAVLLASPAIGAELLPLPAGLKPNVRFWTRVYAEIDASAA